MMGDAQVCASQDAFWQAAERLLFHHTNPWELDEALVAWGFAMGPCEAQDLTSEHLVNVFVPTTPNPTSGVLVMAARESLIPLKMNVEEALRLVVSGGIVVPEYSKELGGVAAEDVAASERQITAEGRDQG